MNVNKVIAAGRIGKDPEMKTLPSGMEVTSFSIAVNRTWKDKNSGEKKEATEWINLIAFGKTAAVISQYFAKGKEIYVEGRMQTRMWEKDGHKNYRTEVVIDTFQFVGSKASGGNGQTGEGGYANMPDKIPSGEEHQDIQVEDIPF